MTRLKVSTICILTYLDMPIFSAELAAMKAKEEGQTAGDHMEDDEVEEGSSESVSSFGEGGQSKQKAEDYPSELEDSEEDKEDYTIRKSDALIVTAMAESDHSSLEVYLYDHKTSDLYVHHEIILSSYPLCLEWLPRWKGHKSNLVVVGTFLPQIEIWNLDSEDCEPVALLGDLVDSRT